MADMAVEEVPDAKLSVDLLEDARAHLAFLREIVEHAEMFDERKLRNGELIRSDGHFMTHNG